MANFSGNPPESSEPGVITLQPYFAMLLCFRSGLACLPHGLETTENKVCKCCGHCWKETDAFPKAKLRALQVLELCPREMGFCYYWFAKTQEYIVHCITFRWSHPKQNKLVGPLILIKHLGSRDCATILPHWQGFCHETFVMFLKQIFLW